MKCNWFCGGNWRTTNIHTMRNTEPQGGEGKARTQLGLQGLLDREHWFSRLQRIYWTTYWNTINSAPQDQTATKTKRPQRRARARGVDGPLYALHVIRYGSYTIIWSIYDHIFSVYHHIMRSIARSLAPSNYFGGSNFELWIFSRIIWGGEFRIAGVHQIDFARLRISNYFSK